MFIPPRFLAFHIPLIFALWQLKTSEICMLFKPIKLQIFSILKINFHYHMTSMVVEMLQKELLCNTKIYFYSIKINLYSVKYTINDIKIHFHSVKTNLYSKRNIFIIWLFFIQLKYFFIWIFHSILFQWPYLVFHFYF